MRTPFVLLKAIGKAVLNACGGGVLGDILIEALPEIANNVWEDWGKEQSAAERQAELEALAQSMSENLGAQIEDVVREIGPDASPESKRLVGGWHWSGLLFWVPLVVIDHCYYVETKHWSNTTSGTRRRALGMTRE